MAIIVPKGWVHRDNYLRREFNFSTFTQAISFIQNVSTVCEKLNHHPEWKNIYNRIWVDLTTHDAGQVTEKDIQLANIMNTLFEEIQK